MKKLIKISIFGLLPLMMVSCKKDYLTTSPSDQITVVQIFPTTTTGKTAIEGIYRVMFSHAAAVPYGTGSLHSDFGQKAYDIVNDLMGNDMVVNKQGYGWFNRDYQYTERGQITDSRRPYMIWTYNYYLINAANNIIQNIDAAKGPDNDKKSIKGQAYAVRAYAYYNLVNWFQQTYKGNESAKGVPIYKTTAITGNPRGTVKENYDLILSDLTQAENLLTGLPSEHKSHINVLTVQGIRARVSLTMENWADAATYANKARTGYTPMPSNMYTDGFNSISNPEWMWGMEVNTTQATVYASFFSHMDANAFDYAQLGGQKKITKSLFDKINPSDVRYKVFKKPGTGTTNLPDYCQNKFHLANPSAWAGDYLFMRASEMYLIEAEALARQGNTAAAKTTLETLIKARYAGYAAPSAAPALLDEILLQRRIELWGEGFSLFDIKRLKTGLNRPTGAGNHGSPNFDPKVYVLPPGDPQMIMKIPQTELDVNLSMTAADQNP